MMLFVVCLPLRTLAPRTFLSLSSSSNFLPSVLFHLLFSPPRSIFLREGPRCGTRSLSLSHLHVFLSRNRILLVGKNASLDPADVTSPRYNSAATLSPWHPLGCRRAKLTRRRALSLSSRRPDAKRCSLRSCSLTTSPRVRSFVRSPRPPYSRIRFVRGLPPGEHNFDPLDGNTPLDHLESSQIRNATRARLPFAFHYRTHTHTHTTTMRGRSADCIAETEEQEEVEDGRKEERVGRIHDMFYHPEHPTKK